MLNKLSPFFAIICSFFVLKEVAGKLDWADLAPVLRIRLSESLDNAEKIV